MTRRHTRRDGLRKICEHNPRTWGKHACLACPWYANEQLNGIPPSACTRIRRVIVTCRKPGGCGGSHRPRQSASSAR
jgi:hypothetical protein